MNDSKVRWEEMLPHEFVEARDACSLCYMPFGLAEPHGWFNALGLDWLKATALVEAAASEHGGIVAPPFCWHMTEVPQFHDDGHGNGWFHSSGIKQSLASSIPPDLFFRTVFHQIRAFDARGFHAAILVTGHYGGLEKGLRKLCEYYTLRTGSPLRLYAIADWECIPEEQTYRGDHAGMCETSQLMALRPKLTDVSRLTGDDELGSFFAGGIDWDSGEHPSEEIGKTIVDAQIKALGRTGKQLLSDYTPREGWQAPNQTEADELWFTFYNLTRKYWQTTWQEYCDGKTYDFPSWESLGLHLNEDAR